MWINRKNYEFLTQKLYEAKSQLRYYTDKIESLRRSKDRVVVDCIDGVSVVLISLENFYNIIKKESLNSDVVKNINAELEWYKVRYHAMKNDTSKTGKWILHNDGSATCDQCRFTQKNVYDQDNYQNYCGVCGAKMSLKSEEV